MSAVARGDEPVPYNEIATITPERARELLGFNVHNRKTKSAKIAQYAREMASGNWPYTGDAIKFDTDRNLLDGQNRLLACIEADVPFVTAIVWNLPAATQEFMDIGATRNAADALTLRGYANVNILGATARTHYAYTSGSLLTSFSGTGGRGNLSVREVIAYIEEHPEFIEIAPIAKAIVHKIPIGAGNIGTAMAITAGIDAEASETFFDDLLTGRSYGVGDPTNAVREKTANLLRNRNNIRSGAALYILFRAWNAVRAGEDLRVIRLGGPSPKDAFRIPDPR